MPSPRVYFLVVPKNIIVHRIALCLGLLFLGLLPIIRTQEPPFMAEARSLAAWEPAIALERGKSSPQVWQQTVTHAALRHSPSTSSGQAWVIERVDTPRWFSDMGDHSLALDANRYPHIAYGSDSLYYARRDGTSWHRETVDDSPGVGRHTSLALDASGHPHISYLDSLNGGLKYAWYDGASWQIEVVDSEGGLYTTLILDSAGLPHISYGDFFGLRYAHYDGTGLGQAPVLGQAPGWQIEIVAPTARVGDGASMTLDETDRPHLAYCERDPWSWSCDDLMYTYYDGTSWQTEMVDSEGGEYVSLALDSAGHPHLSYQKLYPHWWQIKHTWHDGAQWHIEMADGGAREGVGANSSLVHTLTESNGLITGGGSVYRRTSLALDTEDHAHISYRVPTGDALRYAWYDGATWQSEVIDGDGGEYPSLVLDARGQPHLSYYHFDAPAFSRGSLIYGQHDGFAWHWELVDSTADSGQYSSLAMNGVSTPAISHFDRVNGTLKFSHHDGTDWQTEVVDRAGGDTSLDLDAVGKPHIAYLASGSLHYAWYSGTTWITEVVDSAGHIGAFPSLALDDVAGRPHIAYQVGEDLCYAWHSETVWVTETVDALGTLNNSAVLAASPAHRTTGGPEDVGAYVSLALDAAGRPHISYRAPYPHKNLRYAWFDGTIWVTETVDSSEDTGYATSIALDTAGRPHVSYCDVFNGGPKYAYYDGASWHVGVVESGLGYWGRYTSLALDESDRPHVAYYDGSNTALKYAYYSDSGWISETVDSKGDVGSYPSLALSAIGLPHVSYYDATNGDLKHAYRLCTSLTGVQVEGPQALLANQEVIYWADPIPITTSPPITFTWDNGTVGPAATYSWPATGTYTLTVTGTNACGQGQGRLTVQVLEEWPYNLCLPILFRQNSMEPNLAGP